MKTRTVYYVDIINGWNGEHCSVFYSENLNQAQEMYEAWNEALNNINSIHYSEGQVYAIIEEVQEEIDD